jgi:hypothetical protein
VSVDELSTTTLFYLFATEWLPGDGADRSTAVPGGSVLLEDAYGNLVQCALWDLQRSGFVDLEQIRPVRNESVRVLGGASNVAVHVRDQRATPAGVEGQILAAARELGPPTGMLARLAHKMSGDHDFGLRSLLATLSKDTNRPFTQLAGPCYEQLAQAGLVETEGRLVQKITVADTAGVDALRPRFEELRAARLQDADAHPELTNAVIVDGIYAHRTHYSTGSASD